MSTFDLSKLNPEPPSFACNGVEYTATDKIFYPTARKVYVDLLAAAEKAGQDLKEQKKLDKKLFNFLDTLFPGTKKDKIFVHDNDNLTKYEKAGLRQFVSCAILNVPFVPPGCQYTHEEAEAMLALVVTEKAARELTSNEAIYEGLKEQIEKK